MSIFEEKNSVKNAFIKYFGDVTMTKVKQVNKFSLYYARIGCLLCIDDRYILTIVEHDDMQIGYERKLSAIDWTSFQTRTVDKLPMNLKTQQNRSEITPILLDKIKLAEKRTDKNIYMCNNYPLQIELLFSKDNDSYSESGTIQSALDTYNCVVSFTI